MLAHLRKYNYDKCANCVITGTFIYKIEILFKLKRKLKWLVNVNLNSERCIWDVANLCILSEVDNFYFRFKYAVRMVSKVDWNLPSTWILVSEWSYIKSHHVLQKNDLSTGSLLVSECRNRQFFISSFESEFTLSAAAQL